MAELNFGRIMVKLTTHNHTFPVESEPECIAIREIRGERKWSSVESEKTIIENEARNKDKRAYCWVQIVRVNYNLRAKHQ